MSRRSNYRGKKLLRVFIGYGLQLWLVIFITNIAVFYGFSFFSRASTTQPPNTPITATPSSNVLTPTFFPTPTPAGPVLSLSFNMPGISSIGGNIKPQHPVRDVTIYLYDPDANTSDITVRPLYTIKTKATYDNDPGSLAYTSFVNPYIDLGADIKDGDYQIAFKARQALINVIKDPNSKTVGGKKFQLSKSNTFLLPQQTLISGDIYPVPESNNIMDINDYNMLANCFGEKAYAKSCVSGSASDLDDNGVIDGIDYNIMLLSFIKLKEMGFNAPQIPVVGHKGGKSIFSNPVSRVTEGAPVSTPVPAKSGTSKSNPGSGAIGIILFILILLLVGVGAFVAFKLHLLDRLLNILPHKSLPEESQSPATANDENSSQSDVPLTAYPPQSVPPVVPSTPAQATVSASNGTVEESGFLKKVKVDTQKNGTWITLADDSGIKRGFYQGANVADGFVKIKGEMKNDEENKPYILITEISPEG